MTWMPIYPEKMKAINADKWGKMMEFKTEKNLFRW